MGQVTESSERVTAALEAYSHDLKLHGCAGGQVAATFRSLVAGADADPQGNLQSF